MSVELRLGYILASIGLGTAAIVFMAALATDCCRVNEQFCSTDVVNFKCC